MNEKELANELDKARQALRVIHTWATFDGGYTLSAEDTASLCRKVLGMPEPKKKRDIEKVVDDFIDSMTYRECALWTARYDALRRLKPAEYAELCKRNLHGENFDGMVDELVAEL